MHESMKRLYEAARILKGAETPTEVAKLLDTTPQVLNNWERRGISKEGLLTAQEAIGCRAEWVKKGIGLMVGFATGHGLEGCDIATGSDAVSNDTVRTNSRLRTHRLPLLTWEQVGKVGIVPMESLDIASFMESPFQSSDTSFLLELGSESMIPEYRAGEVIQVDPLVVPRHGDDVVALFLSGRSTFRRLVDSEDGRILQALNPQWPDRLMPYPDGTRIIGVAVGSWMKRRR